MHAKSAHALEIVNFATATSFKHSCTDLFFIIICCLALCLSYNSVNAVFDRIDFSNVFMNIVFNVNVYCIVRFVFQSVTLTSALPNSLL